MPAWGLTEKFRSKISIGAVFWIHREDTMGDRNCWKLAENGGTGRIRTAGKGFADLCLNHLATVPYYFLLGGRYNQKNGAGEGVRTLDFNLGKVALYH